MIKFLMTLVLVLSLASPVLGSSLNDEIINDPLGRGYAAMTDQQLLTSLNAKSRTRNRVSMTGREVKAQVNIAEYNVLSDAKKQQMLELIKRDDLDLFGLDRDILIDIFGGGSTTVSNLATARVEIISRSEEIGWRETTTEKNLRMHTRSRKVRR